jgi:hypothetical protein
MHVNFYENLQEAHSRLLRTVVTYDNVPYLIQAICNHKEDGIFRVYMQEVGKVLDEFPNVDRFPAEDPNLGKHIDKWMEDHPDKFVRKMMNSPKFNRFRPFPLGMCNIGEGTYYLERTPARRREQGLTANSILGAVVSVNNLKAPTSRSPVNLMSGELRDTIKGDYPSVKDCLTNLNDPDVSNNAVGFHRYLALTRGPLDLTFLVHKQEVIGYVEGIDEPKVTLGRTFKQYRELVQETGAFASVN